MGTNYKCKQENETDCLNSIQFEYRVENGIFSSIDVKKSIFWRSTIKKIIDATADF